jgi:hypothetical protein
VQSELISDPFQVGDKAPVNSECADFGPSDRRLSCSVIVVVLSQKQNHNAYCLLDEELSGVQHI